VQVCVIIDNDDGTHDVCVYLSLADMLRYKSMVFLRLIPQGVANHIPLPANKNTAVINT
jgi:hypothetical protein